ncbi:MAG: hypothetical protein MUC96_15155 [Myxococcaceae bacterium]|jgi:hypothetical protein|nr:hypothetical protein [Myxococcaceae bacterium]
MVAKRLSTLTALANDIDADPQALLAALLQQIEASENANGLRELRRIESLQELFLGEADADGSIGAALARVAQQHASDPVAWAVIHAALGVPIERAVLTVGTPQKPRLLAGMDSEIQSLRAVVAKKKPLPGALLLLARLPSASLADLALLARHLRSEDAAITAGFSMALLARRLRVDPAHPDVQAAIVAMGKAIDKVPAKLTEKTALRVALAAAGLFLLGARGPTVAAALARGLSVPAPVPPSWGFALGPRARTTSDLVVAVLRLVAGAPDAPDLGPLLSALTRTKLARPDAHDVIAKLLVSIGFPGGVPARPGLRIDQLAPLELRVLQTLRHARFTSADMSMRALGFWSHDALLEFLTESGPRFRPVELPTGGRAPALWVWRAAAIGVLPQKKAVAALVRCGDAALIAELVLSQRERVITEALLKTRADNERDQSLALELMAWLETHDRAWLARLTRAMKGVSAPEFVALGLLRAANQGLVTISRQHDKLLADAFLGARVLEPTLSLVKGLPDGARLLSLARGIFRGVK